MGFEAPEAEEDPLRLETPESGEDRLRLEAPESGEDRLRLKARENEEDRLRMWSGQQANLLQASRFIQTEHNVHNLHRLPGGTLHQIIYRSHNHHRIPPLRYRN